MGGGAPRGDPGSGRGRRRRSARRRAVRHGCHRTGRGSGAGRVPNPGLCRRRARRDQSPTPRIGCPLGPRQDRRHLAPVRPRVPAGGRGHAVLGLPRPSHARQQRGRQLPAQCGGRRRQRRAPGGRTGRCRRRRLPGGHRDRQMDRPRRPGRPAHERDQHRDRRAGECAPPGHEATPMHQLRRRGPFQPRSGAGARRFAVESQAHPQQRRPEVGPPRGDGAPLPPYRRPGQRRGDPADADHGRRRPLAARLLGGQQPRADERKPARPAQQPAHQELRQGQHPRAGRGERTLRGGGALLGSLPRRRDPVGAPASPTSRTARHCTRTRS